MLNGRSDNLKMNPDLLAKNAYISRLVMWILIFVGCTTILYSLVIGFNSHSMYLLQTGSIPDEYYADIIYLIGIMEVLIAVFQFYIISGLSNARPNVPERQNVNEEQIEG